MILTNDNVVGMSKTRRSRCVLAVATTAIFALLLADPAQGAAEGLPADLAIAVTAHPAGTFAHPVTLTITVTNNGLGTLQDAIAGTRPLLDDRPPFTLRPPAGCTTDPPPLWTIKCPVHSLPPGTSTQIPIEASGTGDGNFVPIPITFTLSNITPSDPNTNNNSTTISCVFLGLAARC